MIASLLVATALSSPRVFNAQDLGAVLMRSETINAQPVSSRKLLAIRGSVVAELVDSKWRDLYVNPKGPLDFTKIGIGAVGGKVRFESIVDPYDESENPSLILTAIDLGAAVYGFSPTVPRRARMRTQSKADVQTVNDYLRKYAPSGCTANIRSVIVIDIDGDGQDETIINSNRGTDTGSVKGDHSVVLLLYKSGGKTVQKSLEFKTYRDLEPWVVPVYAIVDLDGDKQMEVITGGWSLFSGAGAHVKIWSLNRGQLSKVYEREWAID